MDDVLRELASRSGGVFTQEQALAAGLRRAELLTAVRRGQVARVAYGVFAPAPLPAPGSPARVALRLAGVAVRTGRTPVAYGRTAAVLHGLPLLGPPGPLQHVLARHPDGSRTDGSSVWLPAEHVVQVRGVLVTSLARTAVDVARRGSLLGGVVTLDGALHAGATLVELREALEVCRRSPGSRRAGLALSHARVGAESALETVGRFRLVAHGLPEPELQIDVLDELGHVGRVDHLWREQGVVGEADGLAKYTSTLDVRLEKLREDRLRDAGLEVVRYTWDQAWNEPEQLAARVRRAFARARRRAA